MLVSVITLLALPTIWLVNRDEAAPARPNVAAVGLDPGGADVTTADDGTEAAEFDPLGNSGAMYLEPATSVAPAPSVVIAVGTSPDVALATAQATYRRSVGPDTCLFNGVGGGETVTVVNVANGRSIECVTALTDGVAEGVLVMGLSRFQRIADVLAAPIHVEIRQ